MTKSTKIILTAILALGIGLRLYHFSLPDRPVFDEAFFATFAADYANSQPHFDIHPPLGKMIYALPLLFVDQENRQVNFLEPTPSAQDGFYQPTGNPYGRFPYIPLRLISILFSGLLILAAFWAVKNISSEKAGLWAAFLIAVESGFIEMGRLITLDTMMIFFGLAALAVFFSNIKNKGFWGGLLWGLAISVKLNAAIFLAPLIIQKFLTRNKEGREFNRYFLIFFGVGLLTLGFFWIIFNNLLIPPTQWLTHYQNFLPELISANFMEKISAATNWLQPIILFLGSGFMMVSFALNGYLAIGGTHSASSPWYAWLIGQKPIQWSENSFLINGIFQFLVLVGLIWLAIKLIKNPTQKQVLYGASKIKWLEMKPEMILAGGYLISFLPFILVNRPTFLYQYLPVFAFGLMLAGIMIEKFIAGLTPVKRKITTAGLILICLISFAFTAPFIYS